MKIRKRILSGALAIGLTLSLSTVAFAKEQIVSAFDDVPTSHWAYTDIMTMANQGAIGGTTTPVNGIGHFDPSGTVSLGQFLTIATRLVASDKIAPQVEGEHWAMANYRAAIEAGIITRNDFMPSSLDVPITRQDMAFILVNVAKVNGETLTITPNIENNINDYGAISQHRENAVKQAYSNGLLQGNGGNFNPQGTAKRAEISAVFCRVMNYVARPEVTVKDTPTTDADDKIIMGGYVSNDGETAGMLVPKYGRQFDLEALSNITMGSDSKGVYVTFTAPQLPTEINSSFRFNLYADVCASNYDEFANSIRADVKSGETVKIYFEDSNGNPVTVSQVGIAKVSIKILNESNRYMFSHSVSSEAKTSALENWYDGSTEKVSFDSSAIFKGIGK